MEARYSFVVRASSAEPFSPAMAAPGAVREKMAVPISRDRQNSSSASRLHEGVHEPDGSPPFSSRACVPPPHGEGDVSARCNCTVFKKKS